jgi:hypothetical protein
MESGGNAKGISSENFVNLQFLADQQLTEFCQSFVQWDECLMKAGSFRHMHYPRSILMLLVLD